MTQLGPKMRVGLRVKELRAGLGVSQEAFAYSIEMSRPISPKSRLASATSPSRTSSASQAGSASPCESFSIQTCSMDSSAAGF